MLGIGIDVGSTNVKVALVDQRGTLIADASRPTATTRRKGLEAEQDPDALWASVAAAVREVTATRPDRAARVGAIGVCSQYSSIVGVDAAGRCTSPLIMYLDRRGSEHCAAILDRHPEAFVEWLDRHGIPPIGAGLSLSHLLHLQLDRPGIHDRTAGYLEAMDLVNLRLTGRLAATQCTMFASQLCDNRTAGTNRYDPALVEYSGVDPARLPPLIPAAATVGRLLPAVADELGLPDDAVVQAGMNDTQAGAFATGATRVDAHAGRTGVVVGTTAVLIRPLSSLMLDLDREVLSMPAPTADGYVVMAENGIAGAALEHALALLRPELSTDERFEALAAGLGESTPGAGGVLFLPWLSGSMSPASSSAMRGGFVGVSDRTTPADLLRSAAEGVARNLRWLLPAVDGLAGSPTTELMLCGGAARSPALCSTISEVLDRPVSVLERPEVAAARAVGTVAVRRSLGEDPEDWSIPVGERHEPSPHDGPLHEKLQHAFESAFTALLPVCEALGP
jgi:xylulokinase